MAHPEAPLELNLSEIMLNWKKYKNLLESGREKRYPEYFLVSDNSGF